MAERGPGGRFVKRGTITPAAAAVASAAAAGDELEAPRETLVSRETSAPPAAGEPIRLRLMVDDVTPAAPGVAGGGTPPPAERDDIAGDDGDDVSLAIGAARGLDWTIGATLGPGYRASEQQVDRVGEAFAPVARRLGDLVGMGDVVDQTVPAPIRELATLAAAAYVAWGDAAAEIFAAAVERFRGEDGDDDDGSTDGQGRRADRGARGGRGGDRSVGDRPADVRRAAEAAPEDRPLGPPGPREGRSADLAAAFAHGGAVGSGVG